MGNGSTFENVQFQAVLHNIQQNLLSLKLQLEGNQEAIKKFEIELRKLKSEHN